MLLPGSKKTQTIILILLVTSFCIAIMGWMVYFLSTKQIEQGVQRANYVSLLRTKERMETYFRQIDQSINQFEKVPAVQNLLSFQRDEGTSPLEIIGIPDLLLRMQTTMDHVDNIALYQTGSRKVLFSTNLAMTDFQGDYHGIIAEFERLNKDYALLNTTTKSGPTAIYIRKLPLFFSTRTGYILFHINQKFYDDMLGSEDVSSQGNYFIFDQEGSLIQNRGLLKDEVIRTEIARHMRFNPPQPEKSPSTPKGEFFVTQLSPSFSGWIYGFAIPNRILIQKITTLRNVIFMIAGILVVMACLVIVVSTNRLWRGWGKITQLLDESVEPQAIRTDAVSQRIDEFDQIFMKVRHMKNNRDALKEQVRELVPELRETFIRNILDKGVRTDDDLEKFKKYDISLAKGLYCCLCIEMDQYNSMIDLYSEVDIYYFQYALSNVISEVLQSNGKGFAVNANHGRFLSLLTMDTLQPDEALDIAMECARTIRDFVNHYFPFTISVGISRIRKDVAHLNLSSQEAADSLKHKLVAGTNQLISSSHESHGEPIELPFSFRELENNIIYAIRTQNEMIAYQSIDQIYALQGFTSVNYQWVQSRLVEMIYSVFRNAGETLQQTLPEPIISDLLLFSSLDEWITWIKRHVINVLMAGIRQNHREHMEKICSQIAKYVQSRLQEDLRLEHCCKQLNIPLTIAKQALKEVEDATFVEYVLHARVELAKTWLIETEQSIDDIALKLYYSNAQNFSRTFKKAVGMPPGQFRKENR